MPPRPTSSDRLARLLGKRIRARRKALGKTLNEVAEAADISRSYLSSVETGGSISSLPVLARIAHALDLGIADLVAIATSGPLRRSALDIEAPQVRTASDEALQLRIAFQTSDPGDHGPCPVPQRDGTVFAYLHSGSLDVTVDGETLTLHQGDAIHIEARESVTWRTGEGRATCIWASAPPTPH